MINLLEYRSDRYSQAGQDGIIEYILRVLGVKQGHFVEFGAWDGVLFSNCRRLFEAGWSGVFIEGDRGKFEHLLKNYRSAQQIVCVNEMVGVSGHCSFDEIMARHSPDRLITFLSIDVDGLDLEIFESIERFEPLVVCLEGGQGPHPLEPRMPVSCTQNIGQSLSVIAGVAERKGYEILASFQDVFLVRRDLAEQFDVSKDAFRLYVNGLRAQPDHIPEFARRLRGLYRRNRILDFLLASTNYATASSDQQWLDQSGRAVEQLLETLPASLQHACAGPSERVFSEVMCRSRDFFLRK